MRGIGKAESNFSQDFYNRQCHIIGIGIDKYKYKDWPILNNCEKDVERFISTVCSSFKTFEDIFSQINSFEKKVSKSL